MEIESLSPNLAVADISKSLELYVNELGFARIMQVPDAEPFVWVMLQKGDITLMLQEYKSLADEVPGMAGKPTGGSFTLYIKIKGIRELFESLKSNVNILKPLSKTFYGATEFTIEDADGYFLTFAEDE